MTSRIGDVEAIRNCTHECEYAPPTRRLSTGPIYSDFPVARALQGRPHVRRSPAADAHRTPLQNDDRHPRGGSAGTSGVFAHCKHARRWAAWATPRTGVWEQGEPL